MPVRPLFLIFVVSIAALLSGCNEETPSRNTTTTTVTITPSQTEGNSTSTGDCESDPGIDYLCGVTNGEDILRLGNSNWLLVSGMDGSLSGTEVNGRIHLVDATARTVEILFPGQNPVFEQDRDLYPDCPGSLDTTHFSAHGLALQKIDKGPEIYRLYMTSHGEREAIEVFEVDAFLKPTIKWVGCVLMPSTSWTNSVAILRDGGFLATQFYDPGRDGIQDVMAGKITGHVFEWHPGGEVGTVPGTELAGANGIAVSGDERWAFVAAYGSSELVRFDRSSTPVGKEIIPLSIYPDNVRWTDTGNLYVTGNNTPDWCGGNNCTPGWSVIEVVPYRLSGVRVAGADEQSALQDPSSALGVNNDIWVGTFSGDRLAILPK